MEYRRPKSPDQPFYRYCIVILVLDFIAGVPQPVADLSEISLGLGRAIEVGMMVSRGGESR